MVGTACTVRQAPKHATASRNDPQVSYAPIIGETEEIKSSNSMQSKPRISCGSDDYDTALLDRRALSINLLAYAQGLFRAAQLGAKQFNQSAVINIAKAGTAQWRVSTSKGAVTTENVFICTNAYTDSLWPGLAKAYIPIRGFQATTDTIDESILRNILPENHVLTDTRHLWSGIRKVGNGKLQLSVCGPALGTNGSADLATASD